MNSNPAPSGFKAIFITPPASGQGQENQGLKGKQKRDTQCPWAQRRERKIFREGFSGFDRDSGLGHTSEKVKARDRKDNEI